MFRYLLLVLLIFIFGCGSDLPWSQDKQKSYISQLNDNGLHALAAKGYENLAEKGGLADKKAANAFYLAGNIYMENLREYEKALDCYIKAKVMGPSRGTGTEIERKMISCLEKMGKSFDAQKKMDRMTSITPAKKVESGTIVARVGSKVVTMKELEDEIRSLPAYMQKDFAEPQKKKDFLKQYIATELMYDSAKRRQYDKDPEFSENLEKLKKNMMVQKLISEEIADKITVSDEELKYYYDANKDKFVDKNDKPYQFEQVKDQIKMLVRQDKEQAQYGILFDKLMRAEKVEIYEDVFK